MCVCICVCARGHGVCLYEVRTNTCAGLHGAEKATVRKLNTNEKDRGYISARSVIFQTLSNIRLRHLLFLSFSFRIRLEFPCSVKELVHCDGSARREPEHSSDQPCHANTQTLKHKHLHLCTHMHTLMPRLKGLLCSLCRWWH